jgi:hypothetical protein
LAASSSGQASARRPKPPTNSRVLSFEEAQAKPSNFEFKVLVRPKVEAVLSPGAITDREVVMTFEDVAGPFQWGFWFQGPRYRTLVERWFDDLWASIPDRYVIYSRDGFNQSTIDRIRNELEAAETASVRQLS